MKVLLYKDVFVCFIKQTFKDQEHLKQISQIFDNKNLSILYSDMSLSIISEELREEHQDLYQRLYVKIKDSDNFVELKSSDGKYFDEQFLYTYTQIEDSVVISIAYDQPSLNIRKRIQNIAVLSQQQKPNYDWLVVNLAVFHPHTLSVDEIDFKTDTEVNSFFHNLFSIPKKITEVTIFDDYCNVDHSKYEKISKPNKVKVVYCTERRVNSYTKDSNLDDLKKLRKKFSTLQLRTKYKGSHARRIIFEGFIVNPDIDLSLLNKKDNKMWSIHIRFNKERCGDILEAKDKDYKEFKAFK